jgi:beta-N-acetylhexosaminidase
LKKKRIGFRVPGSGFWWVFLLAIVVPLFASEDVELKRQIGRMLIVGFDARTLSASDPFVQELRQYRPGGVILFDRDYHDRNRTKNIASPRQLETLTSQLQALSPSPLLIAVDQEGGKVQRLKPRDGFIDTPSANSVGERDDPAYAKKVYGALAGELADEGINADFAPVVDLAVNPKNVVIYGLGRSFGKSSEKVARYSAIFADALRERGIVPVLKHFPGHGSSLGDSHKGFVDVSETWRSEELKPYERLISEGKADMIMTAHVFNRRLDPDYPATLSRKANTDLLRGKLGFEGVIVSDDLQMKAISEHYTLRETVRLAINAGVDMLLFGNQLGHTSLQEAVEAVYDEVRSGHIPRERIAEANRRIEVLFKQYHIGEPKIIDRPIDFGPERIALTKAYIKEHYGKTVDDITIDPKIIVLHWTAEMDANRSYEMLWPERLRGARTDIASAGALNVSAHFLVDRDGTIYRLMPETWMARHVIGLNYSSIGIENVGGEGNDKEDLTPAQLHANIALVRYLKRKYPDITYLIGHHEYRKMEKSPLWLERDKGYRTEKKDPGPHFMRAVRAAVRDLGLKAP